MLAPPIYEEFVTEAALGPNNFELLACASKVVILRPEGFCYSQLRSTFFGVRKERWVIYVNDKVDFLKEVGPVCPASVEPFDPPERGDHPLSSQ